MSLNFGKYKVETSHEDKILFPEAALTKMDVINYYIDMAEHILPHTKDRPATMQRFPDGIKGKNFYQKETPDYFPEWIDTQKVKKEGGMVNMVVINKKATLAYLANQACITPHIWLSKTDKLEYPDKMVFDLDPPDNDFELVIKGAKVIRKILEDELNLSTFVMTTGSRGLHIIAPISQSHNFDSVRNFAADISKFLEANDPKNFTIKVRKDERKGRLFIDYLRNSYAQTSVVPYALRAIKGAPVATPIAWDELDDEKISAQKYTIKNIGDRMKKKHNPWKNYFKTGQSLKEPMKKFESLINS